MARKPIPYLQGAFYHLMARGIDGRHLFAEHREQTVFYQTLHRIKKAKPFNLLAHCLMSNHFHLVVQTMQATVWEIMHLLQTRFAVIYNRNHARAGHVFQGRYLPLLITDDAYLMTVMRYVHLNPVAAGLVRYPESWINSGHNELVGLSAPDLVDVSLALSYFGDEPENARERYRYFVHAKLGAPDLKLPTYESLEVPDPPARSEIVREERFPLIVLAEGVAQTAGLDLGDVLRGTRRQASKARKALIAKAFGGGYRGAEIADFLGVTKGYVSRVLSGGEV